MPNFGRIPGPAYDRVGVTVLVAVAVGGSGVFEGVLDGSKPWGVEVGLLQAGGEVWVGKITGAEVRVGLNNAVMVKSGVGKTNGVGEATKGKLQASISKARKPSVISGEYLFLFFMISSPDSNLSQLL